MEMILCALVDWEDVFLLGSLAGDKARIAALCNR